MKLVYYSSVLNHHQKCLCDEFYKYYGDDFKFITTMEMETQRLNLGYKVETAPYLFESFRSDENMKQAFQMAVDCDVLLAAVFPEEILHERMKRNKLTFRHIETYFKREKYRLLSPNALHIAYTQHTRYRRKPLYLLCASSHVASDVNLFGAYPGKKFRWGYFPEMKLENSESESNNSDIIEIVWAGRFIEWKKPEYAIRLIADLLGLDYKVHLSIMGTGPMEQRLKNLAKELHVEEAVSFLGAIPPMNVRERMRRADIFLFTSTREEGWGAVLNEAMGSGCAVVASTEAGSTNYLIPDKRYGLKYERNSYEDLFLKTESLCSDPDLRKKIKQNARTRIFELWNYQVAAQRFVECSEKILMGKQQKYKDDGPMSLV